MHDVYVAENEPVAVGSPESVIQNFQKNKIDLLVNHPGVVGSQYGTERESSKDYEGRVVFELFQNAVDRAERLIVIELRNDRLIVSNDGLPFTIIAEDGKKTDFEGLCTIHDSAKKAGESIGNKGVGFKSIWNVCREVLIESVTVEGMAWGFELFNPLDGSHFEGGSLVAKALITYGAKVPSFYFPKYYRPDGEKLEVAIPGVGIEQVKTRITLPIDGPAHHELNQQIEEFLTVNLCFLPLLKKNLTDLRVMVITDGKVRENDNHKGWKVVQLRSPESSQSYRDQLFKLDGIRNEFLKRYDNLPEEPNVAVAFPPAALVGFAANVYTYLPTHVDFGHHVLIHGDFALDNSRTSIPANAYNSCLLEIAADLFVDHLANDQNLHDYPYFYRFLEKGQGRLKLKNGQDIHERIWNRFFADDLLTGILRKVYRQDRIWPPVVYEELYNVMERLFRHEEGSKSEHQQRLKKLLPVFCDDGVFIVPVSDGALTTLPNPLLASGRENLFYRSSNITGKEMTVRLLDGLHGVKISDFSKLSYSFFRDQKITREFAVLGVLSALNRLQKSFYTVTEKEDAFAFCFDVANRKEAVVLANFFDTSPNGKEERELGEIMVPVRNGQWQMARKSFTGTQFDGWIDTDYFNQVDIERCREVLATRGLLDDGLDIHLVLQKMGVWYQYFPLKWDNHGGGYQFSLPWTTVPTDKSTKLKLLINNSISPIRLFNDPDVIWTLLKKAAWFYVENQKRFVSPAEVFLFNENDRRSVTCIPKETKRDDFIDFYLTFQIRAVEDTSSGRKLYRQLVRMSEMPVFSLETGHVELYRGLISAFSKKADYKPFSPVPVLIQTAGKYRYIKQEDVFYAGRDFKRYKHMFKDQLFACFDDDISRGFCDHTKVLLFQPRFNIRYTAQKQIDFTFKSILEKDHLPTFLALALSQLGSKLNLEFCLQRWQQLVIFKDEELLLTVAEVDKTDVSMPDAGKGNHVLYIPLNQNQKDTHKTLVGEVAHDLKNPLEEAMLSRFGPILADGVFRNTTLSEIFGAYLDRVYLIASGKGDPILLENYLQDYDVTQTDIDEAAQLIHLKLLTKEEEGRLIERLCTFSCDGSITLDNWMDGTHYQGSGLSYPQLLDVFADQFKLLQLVRVLDPVSLNRSRLMEERLQIKALVYLSENKSRVLTDQEFDQIANEDLSGYQRFDFHPALFYDDFGIKDFDPAGLESAKIILQHKLTGMVLNGRQPSIAGTQIAISDRSGSIGAVDPDKEEEKRKDQHIQGLGLELLLLHEGIMLIDAADYKSTLVQAASLMQAEDMVSPQKRRTAYIDELQDLLKAREPVLKDLMKYLHVSKAIGDGLGYDILYPTQPGNIDLLKVEVKSARGKKVYFSESERKNFLYLAQDPNWRFWINQVCDRALTIQLITHLQAHQKQLSDLQVTKQNFISAENWFITYN